MFLNYKCNWCNKRKNNTIQIKKYCKWYNFYICVDCYNNKLLIDYTKKPISKPSFI